MQPQIKGTQLDPASLTTAVDTSLSSIFGGDVLISGPVFGETLLFLGSPIGWRNTIGVGGIVAGDGLNSAGGSPVSLGSPITQVLSVDSTVARLNVNFNTFSAAGSPPGGVGFNLEKSDQGADEKIWRIANTGKQFIISTRLDNGDAGNSAIVIARTGATVDKITLPSPLIITASGETALTAAIQLRSAVPTLVFNDTDATATEGVWDITGVTGSKALEFRTRTDDLDTGVTWLSVKRSGTNVTSIDFIGTAMTFNGGAIHAGSPVSGGGGGGDVSIFGSPVDNQLAIWKNGTTIEGDSGLTWDGSILTTTGRILNSDGTQTAPAYSFANATTTGMSKGGGNTIIYSIAGSYTWIMQAASFGSATSGTRPALQNTGATSTTPNIIPANNDPDTGIGLFTADALSLITGGVEALRLQESSVAAGSILQVWAPKTGLTAFAGGGQGNGLIRATYNVYSTVATTGDAATLPQSPPLGSLIYVKNDGANSMDVFPFSSGGDLGEGANIALAVAAGESAVFLCTVVNTTWTQLIIPGLSVSITGGAGSPATPTIGDILHYDGSTWVNLARGTAGQVLTMGSPLLPSWQPPTGGSPHIVPDPLLLSDGTAVAPSYAFTNDVDTGLFYASNQLIVTTEGVQRYSFNDVSLVGFVSNAGGLLNETASATNPTNVPAKGDLDTGLGWAGTDQLSLIAGSIEAVRFTEVGNDILQAVEANVGLTAAGSPSTQGSGVITSSYNVYSTVANDADAITLPAVFIVGTKVWIKNDDSAQSIDVWPASGDNLGAGVDTAVALAAGSTALFLATAANATWTQLI